MSPKRGAAAPRAPRGFKHFALPATSAPAWPIKWRNAMQGKSTPAIWLLRRSPLLVLSGTLPDKTKVSGARGSRQQQADGPLVAGAAATSGARGGLDVEDSVAPTGTTATVVGAAAPSDRQQIHRSPQQHTSAPAKRRRQRAADNQQQDRPCKRAAVLSTATDASQQSPRQEGDGRGWVLAPAPSARRGLQGLVSVPRQFGQAARRPPLLLAATTAAGMGGAPAPAHREGSSRARAHAASSVPATMHSKSLRRLLEKDYGLSAPYRLSCSRLLPVPTASPQRQRRLSDGQLPAAPCGKAARRPQHNEEMLALASSSVQMRSRQGSSKPVSLAEVATTTGKNLKQLMFAVKVKAVTKETGGKADRRWISLGQWLGEQNYLPELRQQAAQATGFAGRLERGRAQSQVRQRRASSAPPPRRSSSPAPTPVPSPAGLAAKGVAPSPFQPSPRRPKTTTEAAALSPHHSPAAPGLPLLQHSLAAADTPPPPPPGQSSPGGASSPSAAAGQLVAAAAAQREAGGVSPRHTPAAVHTAVQGASPTVGLQGAGSAKRTPAAVVHPQLHAAMLHEEASVRNICSYSVAAVGGSTVPAARAVLLGGTQPEGTCSQLAGLSLRPRQFRGTELLGLPELSAAMMAEAEVEAAAEQEDDDEFFEPRLGQGSPPAPWEQPEDWLQQGDAGAGDDGVEVAAAETNGWLPSPLQLQQSQQRQEEEEEQETAEGVPRKKGLHGGSPIYRADPAEWMGIPPGSAELRGALTTFFQIMEQLYGRQWYSPPVLATLKGPQLTRDVPQQLGPNVVVFTLPVEWPSHQLQQQQQVLGSADSGGSSLVDSDGGGSRQLPVVSHLEELAQLLSDTVPLCSVHGGCTVVDAQLHTAVVLGVLRTAGDSMLVLMGPDEALRQLGYTVEIAQSTWDHEVLVRMSDGSQVSYAKWQYSEPQQQAPPPVAIVASLPRGPALHAHAAKVLQGISESVARRAAASRDLLRRELGEQRDTGTARVGDDESIPAAGRSHHVRRAKEDAQSRLALMCWPNASADHGGDGAANGVGDEGESPCSSRGPSGSAGSYGADDQTANDADYAGVEALEVEVEEALEGSSPDEQQVTNSEPHLYRNHSTGSGGNQQQGGGLLLLPAADVAAEGATEADPSTGGVLTSGRSPRMVADQRLVRHRGSCPLPVRKLVWSLVSTDGLRLEDQKLLSEAEAVVAPALKPLLPELRVSTAVDQLCTLDPEAAGRLGPVLSLLTPFLADEDSAPMLCCKQDPAEGAPAGQLALLFCLRDTRFQDISGHFSNAASGLYVLVLDRGSGSSQQQAMGSGGSRGGGMGIVGAQKTYSSCGGHVACGSRAITADGQDAPAAAAAASAAAAGSSPIAASPQDARCRLLEPHIWAGIITWPDCVKVAKHEGGQKRWPKVTPKPDLGDMSWYWFADWHRVNNWGFPEPEVDRHNWFLEFPGQKDVQRQLKKARKSERKVEQVSEQDGGGGGDEDEEDYVEPLTQRQQPLPLQMVAGGGVPAAAKGDDALLPGCCWQQRLKAVVGATAMKLIAEELQKGAFHLDGENGPLPVCCPHGERLHFGLAVCGASSSYGAHVARRLGGTSLRVLYVAPAAPPGSSRVDAAWGEGESSDTTSAPLPCPEYHPDDDEDPGMEASSAAGRKCETLAPNDWIRRITGGVKGYPSWRKRLQIALPPHPQERQQPTQAAADAAGGASLLQVDALTWTPIQQWEEARTAASDAGAAAAGVAVPPTAGSVKRAPSSKGGRKRKAAAVSDDGSLQGGSGEGRPRQQPRHQRPTATESGAPPDDDGAAGPGAAAAQQAAPPQLLTLLAAVESLKLGGPGFTQQALVNRLMNETRQLEGRNAPVVLRVRNSKAQDEAYAYGIGFCPDRASYEGDGRRKCSGMRVLYAVEVSSHTAPPVPDATATATDAAPAAAPDEGQQRAGSGGLAIAAAAAAGSGDAGTDAAAVAATAAAAAGGCQLEVLSPPEFLRRAAAGAQGKYHWKEYVKVLQRVEQQPGQGQEQRPSPMRRHRPSNKSREPDGFRWMVFSAWLKTLPEVQPAT